MKKINFRILFYGLLAFCFALVFARHIFNLSIFHIIFTTVIILAILLTCIKYNCIRRFVFLILIFIIGTGYYFAGESLFIQKEYKDSVLIKGRASAVSTYTGYSLIILDDVEINGENKNFNIQVSASGIDIKCGNVIIFESKLKTIDLFEGNAFNSFCYKNNIMYKTSLTNNNYFINEGYLNFNEQIRNNFNDFVSKNFSEDVAPIISSVIIGDKSNLKYEINQAFSLSGLGHLLAISGLHVGFIVALLNFVLEKLKINKKVNIVILFILIILYCYICNFAPSVVRASLMSIIFMLANLIYRKYDKLNCISFVAWLILFVKPLYIFDASFVLSFSCVFCIFVFRDLIRKLFKKLKFKKLASPLSLICSVQIGLIPVMSLFYSNFNLLSVITNFICVPLFEVVFILTFVLIPLVMILPFLSFILNAIEFLYFTLTTIAGFVSSLTLFNIKLIKSKDIFCVGYYASAFVCSKYVNITKKEKIYLATSIICFSILCSVWL